MKKGKVSMLAGGFMAILLFCIVQKVSAQTAVLELDYISVIPPAGPNTNPITIPFSLDTINNNDYVSPVHPISVTVSLANQVYTGLPYNATAGITFGGGATLSSGGITQQSASNIPYDLLGTYTSNGGPKSYMFTSSPIATPAQLGTGFDVDGDLFSPSLNGGVQLFTAAQVLFDNNVPKDARVYFGDVKFTFSQPVKNPVLHFAGLGGSYSYLPKGLPDIASNYLSTFFTTELELKNPGLTSTLLSSNGLMTLTGNNLANNYPLPNGNSFQIPGEYPIDNYGAMTGSVRINGVVQEVVYRVYLKGSPNSAINWSTFGMDSTVVPPVQLVTGATRDPFTGDIWWATASLLNPTQQISGNVFHDLDSMKDNNIATNGTTTPNNKTNGGGLFANLIGSTGLVVASVPITADGQYLFDSVNVGTYTVQLTSIPGVIGTLPPATTLNPGWTATGERNGLLPGNDGLINSISAPIVVAPENIKTENNFGIRQIMSIGNLVWNDADKNGLKSAVEVGIAGAIVKLYNDVNSDGTADGPSLATFTTLADGLYSFNGLFPGNYIVGVTPPAVTIGNPFVSSPINEANANSDIDNNDNGIVNVANETFSSTISLLSGLEPKLENPNNATAIDSSGNLTVDFGFYQPVNISGNLFVDNNGPTNVDGIGIGSPSGTQVYANLVNSSGNIVATTPINTNGTFQFLDVQPNSTFSISISTTPGTIGNTAPSASLPSGWMNVSEDCCDNIGNDGTTNGQTIVSVVTTNVINANFGIAVPLFLGNYVWTDLNGNGLKDEAPSLGLNGVQVKLFSPGPNGAIGGGDDILLDSILTSSLNGVPGYYLFDSLTTGNYYVSFPITNATAALTTQTSTANTDNNSDANINTGLTSVINLTTNDTTIDAAYLCVSPIANAGPTRNLNCTTPSATIGTAAIAGNSYSWSPTTALSAANIAQPTVSATVSTAYTVTVTASNGCSAQSTVQVNVDKTSPIANAGPSRNLTCTTTSATIGTTAIAGNTYSWSPSLGLSSTTIAQPTANPSATTIYTVTVTGSNGCTAQSTVAVNVNTTPPVADAGPSRNLTCTTTSATIGTAAVVGNTYSWSPSLGLSSTTIAQPTANPSATTIYTVTVTGSNGCTAQSTVAVNVNTTPPVADAGPSRNLTCTTTSATIGTTAIAGNTYSWSPSLGLSSTTIAQPTANPSATTIYTVTVTGSNGCTAQSTVAVNVNTTPPVADAGPSRNLTCTTTSATIGTAAVVGNTYSWSPSLGLSSTTIAQPTANPSATTIYTVTVTAANGCTAQSTVAVNVNTTPPVADAGPSIILNCTTTSGTIGTAAVVGNSYSWSPSLGLSSTTIAQPTASPATTTIYTVTVTAANGCTAQSTVAVNVNTTPPVADAGPSRNLTCTTTSATIGTAAIAGNTYSWSPSLGLSSTTIAQPTANPSATTIYTVTVTAANGCTAQSTVAVNVNTTPPVADAGPSINLTCTTTFATIGTAAIAGNTYSWSPSLGLSSTTIAQPTANPSATTIYTVTVTGSNGCTAQSTVAVNVNTTPPVADAGPSRNLTCTTTSATIGTTAIVGNTYSWSPSLGLSSTTIAQPTANPSATTIYTVTVTAANGCTAQSTVPVNVNTTPPVADAGPSRNLTCTTTSATIGTTAIAGNTYSWSPSLGLSSTTIAQPTANPSATTIYTVTVTGSNGCTAQSTVAVNVNTTPPVADAGPSRNLTCTTTSGTIGTAAVVGNTYSWSPSLGLSSTTIAQPTANPSATTIYTVTVTGSNGCTAQSTVAVNVNTTPPVADAGPSRNLTCTTTSATIGTAAVVGNTYSWSPSLGLSSTTIAQPTANPSATTIYTVTVTAANGCTAQSTVAVNVNTTPPVADAGPSINLTCTTTFATIGTAAIAGNTYSWSPSLGLSSTTIAQPTANPSATTIYTVTVTGSNGCTAQSTVAVNVNTTPPVADAGPSIILNCTTTSGTIGTAAVVGNTYSWSPSLGLSSTTIAQPTASPATTTIYTVTVTAANGCTAQSTVAVNVNTTPPVADAGPSRNLTCTTTSATIGTAAVVGNTYSWSPSLGLSSTTIAQPTANPSATTIYTVTVTGSNGCTAQSTVAVNVNTTPPVADAGPSINLTCTTTSATIGTSAIAGNTYAWSPSLGLSSTTIAQPTANPSATTIYTVTVTAANGCTAQSTVAVNVNTTPPVADAGPSINLTCTTTFATIGTAAIAGNTYSWSPSLGLSSTTIAQPTANPSATTIYTVTVTAANGCTAQSTVSVNVNTTSPVADAGPSRNLTCTTTSATIGTTAIAGNSYSWSPSLGLSSTTVAQPTANPSATTIYTVTVTAANGCTAQSTVSVNVNTTPPVADAGPSINLTCTITSATIGTTAVVGNSYSWSPSLGLSSTTIAQPTASPATTTIYTVTVTGSNGCTAQSTVEVNVNTSPPLADAGPARNLNCTTTSETIGTTNIAGSSYVWTPSLGLSSTTNAQPIAGPAVSTIYTVTVTSQNGCTAQSTVAVNVNTTPPTVVVSGNATVCNGSSTTLLASGANTYNWSTGDATAAITALSGSYTVTGTSLNGCTATSTILVINQQGSVGNYVWLDSNGNGLSNEIAASGINGVTVELWNATSNTIQASTVTANNVGGNPGYYNFVVCTSGNYFVKFPMTIGAKVLTVQNVALATDGNSDADSTGKSPNFTINVAGVGQVKDNTTIDAGYLEPLSLGNLVWNDINRNGIKDPTEPGIAGAIVNLYRDANNDGVKDGVPVNTFTTGTNGLYIFNNLEVGGYIVGVIPPTVTSGNGFISSAINETIADVDNNDNGLATLFGETLSGTISLGIGTEPLGELPNNGAAPDNSSNLTVDFGFYQPITLRGNVWHDINGNTDGFVNNSGGAVGATPIPVGLRVYLVNPLDNKIVKQAIVSSSTGIYNIGEIAPQTNYYLILSKTSAAIGFIVPAASLPIGWENTGERLGITAGSDGVINGRLNSPGTIVNVINANFGIRLKNGESVIP